MVAVVAGSNPVSHPTHAVPDLDLGSVPSFAQLAPLAQLAEHRTLNPQVLGSSPRGRTTFSYPKRRRGAVSLVLSHRTVSRNTNDHVAPGGGV